MVNLIKIKIEKRIKPSNYSKTLTNKLYLLKIFTIRS